MVRGLQDVGAGVPKVFVVEDLVVGAFVVEVLEEQLRVGLVV